MALLDLFLGESGSQVISMSIENKYNDINNL